MLSRLASYLNPTVTPQSEPAPGVPQVPNSAGGYAFALDDWARLDRFLILGSEGGTYYASERVATLDNADAVKRCVAADGPRAVKRIAEVSDSGRAPKNGPAVLALALAAEHGDPATKSAAYRAVPTVCRTGTHLFEFAAAKKALGEAFGAGCGGPSAGGTPTSRRTRWRTRWRSTGTGPGSPTGTCCGWPGRPAPRKSTPCCGGACGAATGWAK